MHKHARVAVSACHCWHRRHRQCTTGAHHRLTDTVSHLSRWQIRRNRMHMHSVQPYSNQSAVDVQEVVLYYPNSPRTFRNLQQESRCSYGSVRGAFGRSNSEYDVRIGRKRWSAGKQQTLERKIHIIRCIPSSVCTCKLCIVHRMEKKTHTTCSRTETYRTYEPNV